MDSRWWPGRSSYAAMSVLTDKAYVAAALRIPWRNCGPVDTCSPGGGVVASVGGVRPSVPRHVRPGATPCVPGVSAGRSTCGVQTSWRPQQPLVLVSGICYGRAGNRSWPGRPPWVELVPVEEAHMVVVPRGLKVQAPEPDFESGRNRVRPAHGDPFGMSSRCESH
jgi:hypothetical protein